METHGFFSLQVVRIRTPEDNKAQHILVFEDVSKLLELEKKLEFESKLAATGQLAAGIAHEIRNPLASILGSIEMLSKNLVHTDEQDKKLMAISIREIHRLNHLITDFLEFAKPRDNEAGDFGLRALVSEVGETVLNQSFPNSSIQLENSVPAETRVHANRERIKQVLFNLFLNSIEAATAGTLTISVSARAEKDFVVLDVKDDGPGVLEENSAKIFDPFFTTKPNGTGLGLATVAQIVKAAKGEIRLLPQDKGAHFQLTIPSAVAFAGTGS
jgi:two-component system sensor histidine kinase PilS (NtrC family)